MPESGSAAVSAAWATHFVPEVRSASIDRPRLRDSLPSRGNQARLVVVEGPAGSGKTTTLAQWARADGHGADALVWVTLHDGDGDRITFWNRVLTALQDAGIAPDGSVMEQLDPTTLQGATLRSSLVRAFSALRTRLVLVIDDFHSSADPNIDEDIRTVVECSGFLSIVIASRTQSSLSDVLTAARLDTKVLNAASFAFTLEETRELMMQHGHPDHSLAMTIFNASKGWPLATRAMLVEADRSVEKIQTVEQPGSFITHYVDSVVKHATPLERELLLTTSVCHEFTAALAAEFCGASQDAVGGALTRLETSGVTTARHIAGTTRFAHHPALRAALFQRAEELLEASRLRTLRIRYATWIEPERPETAFTILCSLDALEQAQAVLARNFATLTSIHAKSSRRALERLPLQSAATFPMLLSARLLIEHANPAIPLAWLEKWFALINDGVKRVWGDAPEPGFPEVALLAGLHHMMGYGETAARFAVSTAMHLADSESPQLLTARSSVPMAHAVVAITNLLNGNYAAADAHYELCRTDAEALGQTFEQARGINGRALSAAVGGDISAASAHASWSDLSARQQDWQDHFGATNLSIAKAWVAIENFDSTAVLAELDSLLPVEGVMELWPLAAIAKARAELQSDGPGCALLNLRDAIATKNARPQPVREQRLALVKIQADLAIMSGRLQDAATLLEETDTGHWGLQTSRARLLLAQGESAAAASTAAAAATAVQNSGRCDHRTFTEARLVQATAAWRLGQEELAVDIATTLVKDLQQLGLRTPLLGVPLADLTHLFAAVDSRNNAGALSLLTGVPDVHGSSVVEANRLSPAERAVLNAITRAGSVAATANVLFLSANTVKSHLHRAYRKLGVSTRREALARAAEAGLLDDH